MRQGADLEHFCVLLKKFVNINALKDKNFP